MKDWLLLAAAIVAEVIATSALKASNGFTRLGPLAWVALVYGAAFYPLTLTPRTLPVGVAYAVWSGAGTVLIALIGWWLYGQRLNAAGWIGMALIIAGVLVLNLFSRASAH